jgi:hypothetical protein
MPGQAHRTKGARWPLLALSLLVLLAVVSELLSGITWRSVDRSIHYFAGLLVWWLVARRSPIPTSALEKLGLVALVVIGTWLPDWDWLVHSHRNPLTHSVLLCAPVLVLPLPRQAKAALFAGLSSHLLADFPTGNVVGLPFDRLWLAAHAVIGLAVSAALLRRPAIRPVPASADCRGLARWVAGVAAVGVVAPLPLLLLVLVGSYYILRDLLRQLWLLGLFLLLALLSMAGGEVGLVGRAGIVVLLGVLLFRRLDYFRRHAMPLKLGFAAYGIAGLLAAWNDALWTFVPEHIEAFGPSAVVASCAMLGLSCIVVNAVVEVAARRALAHAESAGYTAEAVLRIGTTAPLVVGIFIVSSIRLVISIIDFASPPTPAIDGVAFEPAVEPPVFEPTVEPPVFEPAIEPPVFEPAVEPPVFEPAVEPPGFEPAVEPPGFEPAVEPGYPDPLDAPQAEAAHSEVRLSEPIEGPPSSARSVDAAPEGTVHVRAYVRSNPDPWVENNTSFEGSRPPGVPEPDGHHLVRAHTRAAPGPEVGTPAAPLSVSESPGPSSAAPVEGVSAPIEAAALGRMVSARRSVQAELERLPRGGARPMPPTLSGRNLALTGAGVVGLLALPLVVWGLAPLDDQHVVAVEAVADAAAAEERQGRVERAARQERDTAYAAADSLWERTRHPLMNGDQSGRRAAGEAASDVRKALAEAQRQPGSVEAFERAFQDAARKSKLRRAEERQDWERRRARQAMFQGGERLGYQRTASAAEDAAYEAAKELYVSWYRRRSIGYRYNNFNDQQNPVHGEAFEAAAAAYATAVEEIDRAAAAKWQGARADADRRFEQRLNLSVGDTTP